MSSVHVKFQILFDDGLKYYYPDNPGIVTCVFSHTMGITEMEVSEKFNQISYKEFDVEYNYKSKIKDLVKKLMETIEFKNGLNLENSPSPLYVLIQNDLINIENYEYNLNKFFNRYNIKDNLIIYLIYCNQAGTICNDNGIRYYMHSKESGSHNKPHVHVDYKDESASIDIENGEILSGNISSGRALRKIREKISDNKQYFFECWINMTDGFRHDINYHFGNIEINSKDT